MDQYPPLGGKGMMGGQPALLQQIGDLMGQLQRPQGGSVAAPVQAAGVDEPDPQGITPLPETDEALVDEAVRRGSKRPFADRERPETGAAYVVLHSPSHELLLKSSRVGLWSVNNDEIESTLNQMYDQHNCVVLIFTIAGSNQFVGYGFMSTQIKKASEQFGAKAVEEWENPFRVSWVRIGVTPFTDVEHITNVHDNGQSISRARDGQILTTVAGTALCNYIDSAACTAAHMAGVSKFSKPLQICIDMQNLNREQYLLSALTRRKQRLKMAYKRKAALTKTQPSVAQVSNPALQNLDPSQVAQLLQMLNQ
eukprot:TRINITY_DN26308_c0_g1_i1.p1 TRINITY_DN26308_c0_g1~~TRINITY_DN26308_c0_g1_i1.p1  ORF type:complete len:310 (+),score=51.06 TRINITY_DN26308_c0_g1_i1:69-998(+)